MERELRRYQNILSITGIAVIALALWSGIKTMLFFYATPAGKTALEANLESPDEFNSLAMTIMSAITLAIMLGIDIAIRAYVGKAAYVEGRGNPKRKRKNNKKSNKYIVIAIIFAVMSSSTVVYTPIMKLSGNMHSEMSAGTFLLDVFAIYILITLIFAAIKTRKLEKKIQEEKEDKEN